ncbi:MAG: hypothetical protein JWP35_4087 [Caulobacter sp.]|nr:hypothetical protein [Caulobacter sp.]
MRRLIVLIAGATLALSLAAQVLAQTSLATAGLKPDQPFSAAAAPPAPDYADDAAWAGLPDRADAVDVAPDGSTDGQAGAKVDVFFVHPTTYFGKEGWNAAYLDQGGAGVAGVDAGTMRAQASVFNGCCRVYAPRYRQATLYAFQDDTGSGKAALDLAYGDVSRAFDEFLKRTHGRPFILAGHSQGAMHLIRLIRERIIGSPLRKRVVAAYLIGSNLMDTGTQPGLTACENATQTGCAINFNTVSQAVSDENLKMLKMTATAARQPRMLCVNPLTWTVDGAAPAAANLGAIHGVRGGPLGAPLPGFTGAKCEGGMLVLDAIGAPFLNPLTRGGVYHIYDYNLFYMNLRANAVARADAFLKR